MNSENVINNLNRAKLVLCEPQMLNPDMCIRIGQAINDAITLLEGQKTIVRCKNCKWWHESKTNNGYGDCGQANGITLKPHDWFCADGKRREYVKPVTGSATDWDGVECE